MRQSLLNVFAFCTNLNFFFPVENEFFVVQLVRLKAEETKKTLLVLEKERERLTQFVCTDQEIPEPPKRYLGFPSSSVFG